MTILGRDVAEVEALVTDRYLDSLLAAGEMGATPGPGPSPGLRGRRPRADELALDDAVRLASARLTRDLPRFHPSFRFEERLAVRLAEVAAGMRLPAAVGAEADVRVVVPIRPGGLGDDVDLFADEPDAEAGDPGLPAARPFLVRGAVAASALSLAGAAWVAWRRTRGSSPMARAARAAHALRGRPA
jgi:hypothetical protein